MPILKGDSYESVRKRNNALPQQYDVLLEEYMKQMTFKFARRKAIQALADMHGIKYYTVVTTLSKIRRNKQYQGKAEKTRVKGDTVYMNDYKLPERLNRRLKSIYGDC